jgi:hypothetical protein
LDLIWKKKAEKVQFFLILNLSAPEKVRAAKTLTRAKMAIRKH